MIATSLSTRSQPTGRPESAASGPLTRSVQSPSLSSIHLPAAFFFTMRLTGGGAGLPGFCGGLKFAPSFGGGLTPPYGPEGSLTTFGGNPMLNTAPPPSTVESLPESKIATYTASPASLTAIARGSSPSIGTIVGAAL